MNEKQTRALAAQSLNTSGNDQEVPGAGMAYDIESSRENAHNNGSALTGGLDLENVRLLASPVRNWRTRIRELWYNIDFWLGVFTTFLVATAWTTNLVTKHLATLFGGTVAGFGMLIAYINYRRQKQKGYLPVVTTGLEGRLPGSVLAVLTAKNGHNDMIIRSAINSAEGKPVVFLY